MRRKKAPKPYLTSHLFLYFHHMRRYWFLHSHHMRRYWFYMINHIRNFHEIFTFWNPLNQKKRFLEKCLFVWRLWTRKLSIELSDWMDIWHTSRGSKKKYEFDHQPHPTKIVEIRAFFMVSKFFVVEKIKNYNIGFW